MNSHVLRAAVFAANKHRHQRRKDAEASPYINHPLTVANILASDGGVEDPVTLMAAVLHDTVEDTDTFEGELRAAFGSAVADVVMEVTDDKSLPKAERKRLQIVHAPELSSRAKLVKIADKIANLRDIAFNPPDSWSLQRRQEYFDWAAKVIAGLRGVNPRLDALFDEAMTLRPVSLNIL